MSSDHSTDGGGDHDAVTRPPLGQIVPVQLQRIPVALYVESTAHHEGLLREFALVATGDESAVPARLLSLVQTLRARYGSATSPVTTRLLEAAERGDAEIDVTYELPAGVGSAALELMELEDEADEFCRSGALLTLATPPHLVAFKRWYLMEVVRQLEGHPPTPWPDYAAEGVPHTAGDDSG